MPAEKVGETATLFTADHPARKDSPEYVHSRKEMIHRHPACYVCGGTELVEDHHSGAFLLTDGSIVGLNGFGLEWSLGFSADPAIVATKIGDVNRIMRALGEPTYDTPVTDTAGVMAWVDSLYNASLPLCKPHHTGRMDAPSKDANGHEAVGIHEIPFPIWLGQVTCQWDRWDMWSGTTGTLAVAPNPDTGGAVVMHANPAHHPGLIVGAHLAPDHPHVIRAKNVHAAA